MNSLHRSFVSIGTTSLATILLARLLSAQEVNKSGPSDTPVAVTVDAARTSEPISPYIYGQFIEHLGRCIYGGIWAEMLEDRKFFFPVTADYNPYRSLRDTEFPVVGASPWQIIGDTNGVTMVKKDAFVGNHTPRIRS